MSLGSHKARLLTVAGIAAIGLSGAAATGASAAEKTLDYSCDYPLIGAQPLSIDITADLPSTIASGTPTPAYDITAKATAGGDTKTGLSLIGAKTIEGSAEAGSTVTTPDGALNVSVPITVTPYTVDPAAESIVLDASGQTPSLTFPTPGAGTITVDSLALNLTAKKADGSAISLGSASDSDGDANTFDVACTLDPATQDTTLATFTVS